MKALVLKEYHKLNYETVPLPKVAEEDLLVRVKACAICGSDVQGIDGSTGRRIPPIIMGHEAAGIIEQAGARVTNFAVGDRITFDSTIFCGTCPYCKIGSVNLCDNRRVLGVSCDEYKQHGAFAEYVAVPERIAYPLPEKLSYEHASLVEPVAIALHGVRLARVRLNETALVYGAGVIGLITVQLLKLAGCRRILAVDLQEAKLETARQMGATDLIKVSPADPYETIREVLGEQSIDVVVEAVGHRGTVGSAVEIVRKGGRLVQIGNLAPRVEIPLQQLVTKEIQFLGSCASAGEYPDSLDLIASGALDIRPLISAVAPLSEGADWFRRLYNAEPGFLKVILIP